MSIEKTTKRDQLLKVRLSDSELADIEQKATDSGLSKSALVRQSLARVRVRNRDDERKRVAMLNRLNANLNMVAKWCNFHKSSADSIEVLAQLVAIEREIKKFASGGGVEGVE